jgi:hypothetical protein
MGFRYFDQYSLLHASAGVVFYFWSIPFLFSFLLHALFEYVENTKIGINIINTYFTHIGWPGGKPESDSIQNSIGDNISFILGWFLALYLDKKGKEENWYYA